MSEFWHHFTLWVLGIALVVGIFFIPSPMDRNTPRWPPTLHKSWGSVAFDAVYFMTLGGGFIWFVVWFSLRRSGFPAATRKLGKLLGFDITPEMSENRIQELARTRLTSLARAKMEAENRVGAFPHTQMFYDKREQALSAFREAHLLKRERRRLSTFFAGASKSL